VGVGGFGFWGWGTNPQSPIPNPQSPIPKYGLIRYIILRIKFNLNLISNYNE